MTMGRREFLCFGLSAGLLSACAAPSGIDVGESGELRRQVLKAREDYGLPALAVLAGRLDDVPEIAAQGLRSRQAAVQVTVGDRWHIGSCTKSMTATLLARYVQAGRVDWNDSVADLLPDIASVMHPEARAITLRHLVTATAGLPEYPSFAETDDGVLADLRSIASTAKTVSEQRLLVAERMLARAPRTTPGTEFVYCSTGFIIAGAIAERLGGATYERLLEQEVFQPLGIRNFGFGAPGRADILDQPRGHLEERPADALAPDSPEADNPSYFVPAGGLNITLTDWARYAWAHVRGDSGEGRLLDEAAYRQLHAPGIPGGQYASGWGVLERAGRAVLLTHNGSNGAWFADIRIYPPTGVIYLMATNDGREELAKQAFKALRVVLDERFRPITAG